MPDQPADPLHYDMKIPPEPRPDAARPNGDTASALTPREADSAPPNDDVPPSTPDASHAGEQKK